MRNHVGNIDFTFTPFFAKRGLLHNAVTSQGKNATLHAAPALIEWGNSIRIVMEGEPEPILKCTFIPTNSYSFRNLNTQGRGGSTPSIETD